MYGFLFNIVVESYPQLRPRLGKSANIVHNKYFESGLCKLLTGDLTALSRDEKMQLAPLAISPEIRTETSAASEALFLVDRA